MKERKLIIKEIKRFDRERTMISCGVEMDYDFRRLKYVRYADDFVCRNRNERRSESYQTGY